MSIDTGKARPQVVSPAEWRAARKELLAAEKAVTKARDALAARRRRLPMVRVEKDYRFEGPEGPVGLVDLFDGHSQLYVHHFMWLDEPSTGCPSCTRAADRMFNEAHFGALRERDVAFAAYLHGDWPGASVFLRDGDVVYHTYSAYARGMDELATPYQFLDRTVYGRQEAWEDSPDGWPQDITSGP